MEDIALPISQAVVKATQTSMCVYAAILGIISLFLVIVVANVIPWQNSPDRSYVARRWWSLATIVLCAGLYWLFMDIDVVNAVVNETVRCSIAKTNWVCLAFTLGIPVAGTLIWGYSMPYSKVGSMLPQPRE